MARLSEWSGSVNYLSQIPLCSDFLANFNWLVVVIQHLIDSI